MRMMYKRGGDNEEKLKILVEKNSNERDEEKMDE